MNYIKYVYLFWSITFFILTLDIIFEIIFGHNMMGNVSSMSGRIASFFGDELVAGAFYHGFILIFLSYLTYKKVKPPILLSIIISLLIISFLIGERSNFIKIFLSIIIFTTIVVKIDMRLKILSLIFTLLSFLLLTNLNDSYKTRYLDQLKTLFSVNGYKNYLMESQYGAHRDAAFKIFKENKFFGVGIKNFRNEVGKEKFKNENYLKTETRISTHPHQIHYEILSETGIFGYFCFSVFFILSIFYSIKNYLKTKNLYQLSGIIFVIISLLPILPTGSFLSTFTSSIFWLNFAIMCGYNNFKS